jgi:hypothetical protein
MNKGNNYHKKLNNLIHSIDINSRDRIESIHLNQIHNLFITFHGGIIIPKIPVKELDHETAFPIVQDLVKMIPNLIRHHVIPAHNKPASDQHYIHLIQKVAGSLFNYIHMLKIDCKFGGDPANILKRGNSLHYPSFQTNRVYYKSFVFPVSVVDDQYEFMEIRLTQSQQVESDQYFHTYALFDDMNKDGATHKLCEYIGNDLFAIPSTLFPFVQFEYFTACLNVLYPVQDEIIESIRLFEPLFIFLYSKYNPIETLLIDTVTIRETYGKLLKIENNKIELTSTFKESLRAYFRRYSLFRNDELALKGLWEFKRSG